MLFYDQTKQEVLKSLYKSSTQYVDNFDLTIGQLHDFYYGMQIESSDGRDYFPKLEGETSQRFKLRKPFFMYLNITEDIINQLCQNYLMQPTRKIYAGEPDSLPDQLAEIIMRMWNEPQFHEDIQNADRESVLVGGVFAHVQWNPATRGIEVRWYPYDHVWIMTSENDPTRITILKTYYERYDEYMDETCVDTWVYTNDSITHYRNGEWVKQPDNPNDLNPYGCIPFVHLKFKSALNEVWGLGYGTEIVSANQQINSYLSDIRYRDLIQSYKQLVFRDCNIRTENIGLLAPIRVSTIPGAANPASVTTLDLSASTGKMMDNLIKYVSAVYAKYGLSARSILNMSQSAPQSGIAKNISSLDVTKFNQLRQAQLINAETQIAKLGLKIAGYHLGIAANPDDYTIEINFTEYTPPMSSSEKTARQQWLESIGAVTAVQLMAEELDLSEEEARERYINNQVENAVIKQEISKRIAQELGLAKK